MGIYCWMAHLHFPFEVIDFGLFVFPFLFLPPINFDIRILCISPKKCSTGNCRRHRVGWRVLGTAPLGCSLRPSYKVIRYAIPTKRVSFTYFILLLLYNLSKKIKNTSHLKIYIYTSSVLKNMSSNTINV